MADNASLPEQPFISHLVELRDRLMRMVLAVLGIFLVLFPFGNDIYVFIADPLMAVLPEGTSMIATQVASPFLTPFKLALVTAVFVAMPYLLYQFWSFIAPGLYQHEKRLAFPLLVSSILLFYLGAAFAYFVVFPLVFAFLTSVAPEGVAVMTDITHYLDFVLTLFFAFGLAFEVPIATIMLVLAGATTPEKLAAKRPYVIVGAFVLGMLLTPPDIISQTLLALPMWILFEIGLIFARMVARERKRRGAAEGDDDEYADYAGAAATGGGIATTAAAVQTGPAAARAQAEEEAAQAATQRDGRARSDQEMEDEFDRIEREFEALKEPRDAPATDADADMDADAGADSAPKADTGPETDSPAPRFTPADSADMLDEETEFPQRSAIEALVDAKLTQIHALRSTGADAEVRRLLYEVLEDGNDTQRRVARNILEQLDS